MQTELPDNSVVWLNSGSSLRYPIRFQDDKRNVELTGEAFFDIQSNSDVPFEVTTPSKLQVIARETKFNINAYRDDLYEEIVLQEGLVEIKHYSQLMAM